MLTVEKVLALHGDEISAYLNGVYRDYDLCEDMYAQFCEDVLKGLATLRDETKLRAWCYAVAKNSANRIWAQQGNRKNLVFSEGAHGAQLEKALRQTVPPHLRTSFVNWVEEAKAALTEAERELLILRVDREFSYQEIASIQGIEKPSTREVEMLRKQFERLKKKIKELVDKKRDAQSVR